MCPLVEGQNEELREGSASELQDLFKLFSQCPFTHSWSVQLMHKLTVGQVACTLAIIAAQLKQSLVNMLDFVCDWYWQKCRLASAPLKVPASLAGVVPHHGPVWQSRADGCLERIVL